jgi:Putative sensor/2TM domain
MLYLLLGLPLGTLWFSLLVTGFSVGLSLLVVALAGIPILIGVWYGVRMFANVERSAASGLLGLELPAAAMAGPSGNLWVRLKLLSTDRARWRELGFLFLRFPVGIATFTAAVTLVAAPLAIAWAPFEFWIDDDPEWGDWTFSTEVQDLASTYPWSWLLVPLGLLLLVASFHVINLLADACGRWTSAALGSSEAVPAHEPDGDRVGAAWIGGTALLRIHVVTFASVIAMLALIDVADSDDVWFHWPLITWGPVLAIHAALANRPEKVREPLALLVLYGHVVVFVGVMAMLLLIDVAAGGGVWFYWPLITWGAALAIHAGVTRGKGRRPI